MFKFFGRLFCRMGFHWFEETDLIGSLIVPCPLEQCSRPDCGIYRQFNLHAGYTYYTKEAVDRAIERKNAEREINEQMKGIRKSLKEMGLP